MAMTRKQQLQIAAAMIRTSVPDLRTLILLLEGCNQKTLATELRRQMPAPNPIGGRPNPDPKMWLVALRQRYWEHGYRPLEVWGPDQRENDSGKPLNKPGKQPRGLWVKNACLDPPAAVRAQPDPRALNTGLLCREIVGFDVDVLDAAVVDRIVALIEQRLGATPLVRIGRPPKALLVYRADDRFTKIETAELFFPDGTKAQVEVLADGQQFVADGLHPDTGLPYRWTDGTPADVPLKDLPVVAQDEARAIIAEAEQVLRDAGAVEKKKPAPAKPARERLNGAAGGFFSQLNTAALTDTAAWVTAIFPKAQFEPGTGAWRVSSKDLGRDLEEDISIHPDGIRDFGEEEGLSPIDLVMRHGDAKTALDAALWICEKLKIEPAGLGYNTAAPGEPAPLSEQWLALEFVARHEHNLRFTALWGKWHLWVGTHWKRDDTLLAFSLAQTLCRDVAGRLSDARFKIRINDARTRAAVVALARENPTLALTPDQWNADPWLLGTPGGIVDLRTAQMRPATPEDYVSMTTAAAPGGDCTLWKKTVLAICNKDHELLAFLQRWFGYCLTGLTREEKLIFFLGDGGNGKGTVIETIAHVMGDYAVVVAMTTLIQTRHQEHPTEIAKLYKARLAVASETSDGGRINAARVKLLTGGDELTGRYMCADFFDFSPTHKLVISGNRPLIIGRADRAIKRRWNTVNFPLFFEEDTRLKEQLRQEASGILAWLIEGCLAWQRNGLNPPKVVTEATEEYLAAQDDLGLFIAERCETDNPTATTLSSDLYWDWRQWCSGSGVWAGSSRDFRDRMATRFKMTNPKNRPTFHGIRVLPVVFRPASGF
jgi:putative DNA primase/helicase